MWIQKITIKKIEVDLKSIHYHNNQQLQNFDSEHSNLFQYKLKFFSPKKLIISNYYGSNKLFKYTNI